MTTNKIGHFMMVIAVAAATMTGCGKPMTVRDYVNSKLLRGDPGFQATIEAANIAQAAFNLNADTPIMEAKEDPDTFARLADMLSKSRDTYRRARSYRIESASSILEPAKDGVRLTDLHAPNVERVPIPGMEITFRVDAGRDRVIVRQVESARGLPIIRFDAWMKPRSRANSTRFWSAIRSRSAATFAPKFEGSLCPRRRGSVPPPPFRYISASVEGRSRTVSLRTARRYVQLRLDEPRQILDAAFRCYAEEQQPLAICASMALMMGCGRVRSWTAMEPLFGMSRVGTPSVGSACIRLHKACPAFLSRIALDAHEVKEIGSVRYATRLCKWAEPEGALRWIANRLSVPLRHQLFPAAPAGAGQRTLLSSLSLMLTSRLLGQRVNRQVARDAIVWEVRREVAVKFRLWICGSRIGNWVKGTGNIWKLMKR